MMTIYQRYESDPAFHRLVDVMVAHVEQGQFTPTEIREAAMLAQIKYEAMHPRPVVFSRSDVINGKV